MKATILIRNELITLMLPMRTIIVMMTITVLSSDDKSHQANI